MASRSRFPGRPEGAHAALEQWISATPRSRVLFLRRRGPSNSRPHVFAVRSEEAASEVRRIGVERLEDLADADLDSDGEDVDTSLVLVCGHGGRDRCCASRGTAVFDALRRDLPHDGLWISSHQGGHRFAGNVLVLPAGIQLGRVDASAAAWVAASAVAGRVDLARFRGHTYYDGRVQAAEHAVREATGPPRRRRSSPGHDRRLGRSPPRTRRHRARGRGGGDRRTYGACELRRSAGDAERLQRVLLL